MDEGYDVFMEVNPEDVDEEKLKQFNYGDAPEVNERRRNQRALRQIEETVNAQVGDHNNQKHRGLSGCPLFQILDVAIAYESNFCSKLGGSSGAEAAILDVVALANEQYESLCLRVQVGHLEGYCGGGDPYSDMVGGDVCSSGLLGDFKEFWKRNRQNVGRTVAHLFHGYTSASNILGCAYRGTLCWDTWGYGVNEITFSSYLSLRTVLFAHELGHVRLLRRIWDACHIVTLLAYSHRILLPNIIRTPEPSTTVAPIL
jgi:hypothetical protein